MHVINTRKIRSEANRPEHAPTLVNRPQKVRDVLSPVLLQRDQRQPLARILHHLDLPAVLALPQLLARDFEHVAKDGRQARQDAFVDSEEQRPGRKNDVSVRKPKTVMFSGRRIVHAEMKYVMRVG